MKPRLSLADSGKTYAFGIGICAIALIVFAVFAVTEPSFAANEHFGLDAATPPALKSAGSSLPVIIGNVIKAALSLVGVVFLVLMIYAGIRWMTARGESKHAETAKETITRAVIGLIIVASAYAITSFVLSRVAGSAGTGSASSTSSEESGSKLPSGSTCTSNSECQNGKCVPDLKSPGRCSTTSVKQCFSDSQCPSGETCKGARKQCAVSQF